MTTSPHWVLSLTDDDLEQHFGRETLRRGRDYARQGRVSHIKQAGTLVVAMVRGSHYQGYQTSVTCPREVISLTTTCTCPMRHDCKHAAALIWHLRTAQRRRSTSAWQQALAPLVQHTHPTGEGTSLALQFNDHGYGITVRPLKLGARGRWVKTGATWDDLRFSHSVDPTQRRLLIALLDSRQRNSFSYGHRPDALPLSELLPDAWPILRDAVTAGVPLLGGENLARRSLPDPALLADPADPVLQVEPQSGGGLTLTARVRIDGHLLDLPRSAFLGRPPHGIAVELDRRLILAPLARPLQQAEQDLFVGTGPLSVPPQEAALFSSGFLPQLRKRLTVEVADGLDLPEPLPPLLICRVTFQDATASVRWAFRYRLGEHSHDLGLAPSASDPPLRDPDAEAALAASLPDGPWRGERPGGAVELRPAFLTGRALFSFTARTLPALDERDDVLVEQNEAAPEYREADEVPVVSLTISEPEAGDWFNLGVAVSVDGEQVPFAALFAALSRGHDHLLLDSGTWFSLDRPEFDQLRTLVEEARLLVDHDGDTFRLRPEHAGLWAELVELGVVAAQSEAWQRAVGALLDLDALPDTEVPAGLRATLRPYQQTGYSWLSFLWQARLGGILADEMGLGKTVQAIALAQATHEAGELTAPMLVVAPTSVVGTWAAETGRFAPDLRVVAITETEKRRGVGLADAVTGAQVVLTSYTLLRLETEAYTGLPWSAVLLDEAQFVKNHASKAYQAVRRLTARVKVALTGTPLENNLMDLWSLLSITAPGLFPHPNAFTEAFRKPIESGDADALARLHRRIRPLILRRTKAAVAAELPDKQEQVIPVPLSPGHRRIYDKHLARERQRVLGLVGDLNRNRITILRSLTLLRQLSLSPVLIDASYPAASAKIDRLMELLAQVTAEGHRALVFSQFTGFLKLVKARLESDGLTHQYLDGRTRDRAARIAAFRDGDDPVFLISLKAGGFGLTLTEADYVFILDPWWNPAAESQAVDRTHRIGQDKPVNVYRLVASDTIEEKVVALQDAKRHLFDQVVGAASDIAAPLSADDIRGLLEA